MLALLWRGVALFTPGGWILSAAWTALTWIGKGLLCLGNDIADAFKTPCRLVVRTICLIAVFFIGGWCGMSYMSEQRDIWRKAHFDLVDDARKADAKNKEELNAALKAKAEAIAALKVRQVKTVPVAPVAGTAKRVQPKRAASGKDGRG